MFPKRNYNFDYKAPSMANGLATLDDIHKISPFFTATNPVTYAIYLEANKNKLSQDEIEKAQNYIAYLTNKENEAMKSISKHLKTRDEYEATMSTIEEHLEKNIN